MDSLEKNKKSKFRFNLPASLANFGLGEEKEYFIENLYLLLSSGMGLLENLRAIQAELKSQRMKKMVAKIIEEIEVGSSLSNALSKVNILPDYAVALVRLGEKSGRLVENLKVINEQQKRERFLRSKVNGAMLYPVFVLALTTLVSIGIAWFVLPRISSVFTSLGSDLPWTTRAIISFGKFFEVYGLKASAIFIGAIVLFYFLLFKYSKTKFIGQGFIFSLPIIKRFVQEIQLSRMGFVLGSLLEAGLPVMDALNALRSVTDFQIYRKFYDHLADSIQDGESFRKSFLSYKAINKIMPVPMQQMIIAGEQSGKLSEILLQIADNYENKLDDTAKAVSVLLEPVLLFFVGLGVAFMAIGVILPIYNLMNKIGSA